MKTDSKIIAEYTKSEADLKLLYRLGVSELEYEEGTFPSYSIYTSVENEATGYFDEVTVSNLTSLESVAMDFLNLISRGNVTPMTLIDVAEDFLSEV